MFMIISASVQSVFSSIFHVIKPVLPESVVQCMPQKANPVNEEEMDVTAISDTTFKKRKRKRIY